MSRRISARCPTCALRFVLLTDDAGGQFKVDEELQERDLVVDPVSSLVPLGPSISGAPTTSSPPPQMNGVVEPQLGRVLLGVVCALLLSFIQSFF